ncbi:MAG: replication-associated recombination protein A [Defluviitaleaceae bacterium]|nr:replication-associated recombination protein A [Defluviitaleaceae bacterium]
MDIFEYQYSKQKEHNAPLAAKIRPTTLEDFVGQNAILGKNTTLYNAIINDTLTSLILYGPTGTGKTTLAKIIANTTKSAFVVLNATAAGVKDIREIVQEAKNRITMHNRKTTVFIDEIHRFNKAQQDTLLPYVEEGTITIIGATTENPFFEVNRALLSRSMVFTFETLSEGDIKKILERAVVYLRHSGKEVTVDEDALNFLAEISGGDARYALNGLEMAILQGSTINVKNLQEILQRPITYDKAGDGHYNTISAFIKSMRGSDPQAAVFYLSRMLKAGEDPRFVARRMIIAASEDIGNADPQALLVATAAAQAVEHVGMPECRIVLAQAATYLATAPKSNAAYMAINTATEDADKPITIPPYLKGKTFYDNPPQYKYPHSYPNGYVPQQYLPQELEGKMYYQPKDIGYERKIKSYLENIKNIGASK